MRSAQVCCLVSIPSRTSKQPAFIQLAVTQIFLHFWNCFRHYGCLMQRVSSPYIFKVRHFFHHPIFTHMEFQKVISYFQEFTWIQVNILGESVRRHLCNVKYTKIRTKKLRIKEFLFRVFDFRLFIYSYRCIEPTNYWTSLVIEWNIHRMKNNIIFPIPQEINYLLIN